MPRLARPAISPAGLQRLPQPFDHPDFLFELKYDGFRALAFLTSNSCELVSRRGNIYKSFAPLRATVARLGVDAILDGEIVCLDHTGRPQFYNLLHRRADPIFYAFDCLFLNGCDLRTRPTIKRKQILRQLVADHPSILPAHHELGAGTDLFRVVCQHDLEGIVAKPIEAPYGVGWFKIRNPHYSQYEDRRELFEKKRPAAATKR